MYPINNPNVGNSTTHGVFIGIYYQRKISGFPFTCYEKFNDLPKLFYLHSRGEHESRGIGSVTCDAPIGSGKHFIGYGFEAPCFGILPESFPPQRNWDESGFPIGELHKKSWFITLKVFFSETHYTNPKHGLARFW